MHTGVSRVGERLAAVGNALRGANAAAPVRSRVRVRMAFEHHALGKQGEHEQPPAFIDGISMFSTRCYESQDAWRPAGVF